MVVSPLFLLTLVQWYAGWMQPRPARVWSVLLGLGHFTQTSHFLAHRRVHLGRASLPPFVGLLQDVHFLLHPSVHLPHHETYDCNFCIWNGWANPIVNGLFRLALASGLADRHHIFPAPMYRPKRPHDAPEGPTAMGRGSRDADGATAAPQSATATKCAD